MGVRTSTVCGKWAVAKARGRKRIDDASPSLLHWGESLAFYKRNKTRLLRDERFSGKFIAVRHRRIVDVDADKWVLAKRLDARYPDQIFFVTQVVAKEPIYEITSVVVVR